jgi:hypothetical protein
MLPSLRWALELDPAHYLTMIPTDSDFDAARDDLRFRAVVEEFEGK